MMYRIFHQSDSTERKIPVRVIARLFRVVNVKITGPGFEPICIWHLARCSKYGHIESFQDLVQIWPPETCKTTSEVEAWLMSGQHAWAVYAEKE